VTKPNFFIVGAPKCGTTVLYEYLRRHPNVFMPKMKEPHFFTTDLGCYPMVKGAEDYTALFAGSTGEHTRHSQLLYVSEETVGDFQTAWRLQERRRRGLDLPPTCREPFLVQYAQLCQLGTQTQRLLSVFPRSQMKLIVFDDFTVSPGRVYDEVINDNKRARIPWLKHFMRKPPLLLRTTFRRLKQATGAERWAALKSRIVKLNTVKERRPPLSPAFRAELVETFRDEVALLSRLLNRDLSHWTPSPARRSPPRPLADRTASIA